MLPALFPRTRPHSLPLSPVWGAACFCGFVADATQTRRRHLSVGAEDTIARCRLTVAIVDQNLWVRPRAGRRPGRAGWLRGRRAGAPAGHGARDGLVRDRHRPGRRPRGAEPFDRFPGVGVVEAIRAAGRPTAAVIVLSRSVDNPYLTGCGWPRPGPTTATTTTEVADPGHRGRDQRPSPDHRVVWPNRAAWPSSGLGAGPGPTPRSTTSWKRGWTGRSTAAAQKALSSPAAPSCASGARSAGSPAALAARLGPGTSTPRLAHGRRFREPGARGRAPTSRPRRRRPGVLRRLELPGHHLGPGNRVAGVGLCRPRRSPPVAALPPVASCSVSRWSTAGAVGWCRPSPWRRAPVRSDTVLRRQGEMLERAPRTAPPGSGAGRCGRRPRRDATAPAEGGDHEHGHPETEADRPGDPPASRGGVGR